MIHVGKGGKKGEALGGKLGPFPNPAHDLSRLARSGAVRSNSRTAYRMGLLYYEDGDGVGKKKEKTNRVQFSHSPPTGPWASTGELQPGSFFSKKNHVLKLTRLDGARSRVRLARSRSTYGTVNFSR